jgi:hypothetical protein
MAKASLLVGTDASPEAESRAVQRILSIYNRLKADEGLNQTLPKKWASNNKVQYHSTSSVKFL